MNPTPNEIKAALEWADKWPDGPTYDCIGPKHLAAALRSAWSGNKELAESLSKSQQRVAELEKKLSDEMHSHNLTLADWLDPEQEKILRDDRDRWHRAFQEETLERSKLIIRLTDLNKELADIKDEKSSPCELCAQDDLLLSRLEQKIANLNKELAEARAGAFREAIDLIQCEEELPGEMPNEMWDSIKNDRDACLKSHQIAVRATKFNCIERIKAKAAEQETDMSIERASQERKILKPSKDEIEAALNAAHLKGDPTFWIIADAYRASQSMVEALEREVERGVNEVLREQDENTFLREQRASARAMAFMEAAGIMRKAWMWSDGETTMEEYLLSKAAAEKDGA